MFTARTTPRTTCARVRCGGKVKHRLAITTARISRRPIPSSRTSRILMSRCVASHPYRRIQRTPRSFLRQRGHHCLRLRGSRRLCANRQTSHPTSLCFLSLKHHANRLASLAASLEMWYERQSVKRNRCALFWADSRLRLHISCLHFVLLMQRATHIQRTLIANEKC